ncbi:16S rRNA (cytidine(1402)-2'-O)-methyltransferase [Proteiniclasticum sp. BAD-10]|uniref:Ribosomal RNA small subunit methyltransferase I n=1 Tax=Proteiniclasticum sediminis TaxID=2804028 RepID=A0A941CT16_9CLOT|nr:16S rRNA (cytidine(1402)-2'-O)-methyltransferase [Proteiniclasticum sediminis]MBR0577039.1 16S rRNA (cytidine(1402)-2'-O)-methyltransferase [Proteiniclasticum sediminis]
MSKLYLVPTPIGNLKDISFRVLEVLQEADRIACEDTRVTAKLLNRYEIKKPLLSYREHNEQEASTFILDKVEAGETIALVTDAGMPGISDPGETIVKKAVERGVDVVVLPGPSALINALVASGLDTGRFTFVGFLDKARKKKRDELAQYRDREETLIFYEAPHRILDTLDAVAEVYGNRRIALSRELTKLHEEHLRGTVEEVRRAFQDRTPKGEFVLVVSGKSSEEIQKEKEESFAELTILQHLQEVMSQGLSKKDAVKIVAELRGIPKKEVYKESLLLD